MIALIPKFGYSAFVACVLAAFSLRCGAAEPHRTLQVDDSRRIVSLEEPAISPDGRRIAFIEITPDYAAASYRNELWTVDVDGSHLRRLVDGHDVAVPRWSPDGSMLTYLIRAGGHLQLARYAAGGSVILTDAANDVIDFAWRPDGRAIAYTAYDPVPRRDYFEPADTDYTLTAPVPPVHLWLVDADGAHARRLTHGSWTVAPTDPGGIFTSQFAWDTQGRTIAFTRVANTASGDNEYSTIQTIDVATGKIQHVTPHDRFELTPEPYGNRLAYWYPQAGNYLAQNQLHVFVNGTDRVVSNSLDRNVGGTVWLPRGDGFLACGDDAAHGATWRIGLDGTVRVIPLSGLTMVCDSYSDSTFDAGIAASVGGNGAIAFVATDARHARELYYLTNLQAAPRRLTHFNDFLNGIALGRMQRFAWKGPRSRPETGVLVYPPSMRPGEKYPIVVLIHGGPGEASTDSFVWESWPLAQLIAARGYVVFEPNYRGSDDNGNAFMLAITGDTVDGPSKDILSGLQAVKALGTVDARRVAVCGWSYGGLLTSWLETVDHEFRAAISGAAVNDETEEYNLSVSNVQNRYYLGISPFAPEGAATYAEQSPITFASRITTPTLIWSTTGDAVVPTTMSYSMFHALKEAKTPVKFGEFDAPSHGPDTPVMTEELTTMWLAWLDRYMRH
jgi:dipeptidyl aminopeptidase/acylaminoacyl peptidase